MATSRRARNKQLAASSCCEKHGQSFEISEDLNNKIIAFIDQGALYQETGDISLLGGLVLLATNIYAHEEYSHVSRELNKSGYGDELTVLRFLAIGGEKFKKNILSKGENHVSNEL